MATTSTTSAQLDVKDDSIFPLTRAFSVAVVPFLVLAFIILYLFPDESGRRFALHHFPFQFWLVLYVITPFLPIWPLTMISARALAGWFALLGGGGLGSIAMWYI